MRLSEEMKPKLIAAGVTLLLAPVVWMLLDSGEPVDPGDLEARAGEMFGASVEVAELERELEQNPDPLDPSAALATVTRIETVGPESFGAVISPEELKTFPPAALASIVDALEKRLEEHPGSRLLEAMSRVLESAIARLAPINDPGESLAILRQRAITSGGLERFASVSEKFIAHPRLARWLAEHNRTDPGWILESTAILRDQENAAIWAPFLLWETGRSAPSLEVSAEWARSLAYQSGWTGDRQLNQELTRYLELGDLERRPGGTPATAQRIALWLRSVESLAAVEESLLDRPSSATVIDGLIEQVESAVLGLEAVLAAGREDRGDPGLSARLARRAIVDLTRARISGARLREMQTALPPTGSAEARARKLLGVGMASLELEDHAELSHVIDLLERNRFEFYQRLLEAGRARQRGDDWGKSALTQLVETDQALPATDRRLYPRDAERFLRFAEKGRFATIVDVPALLFESGKTWAELGDEGREWLDRTLEHLRTELHQRRDLSYLTFLEARVALGEGRTEGYESRLLALLDEGPPPGLSRSEIGGLLVLFEERSSQLANAEELRLQAVSALEPLLQDASYDPIADAASLLRFRVDLAAAPLEALSDPTIVQRLDFFEKRLVGGKGLSFDEVIEGLRLRDDLFERGKALADRGNLALAREAYDRVRRLSGESLDLWGAEGELERELARRLADANPADSKKHWQAATHAFLRTARRDPKQSALLIDAARAAIEAGELDLARDAVLEASDSFSHGRGDDSQQWDAIVIGIQIERLLGRPQRVIDAAERAIVDREATMPIREILRLDQAWAYERLGDDERALETLELVRHALGTSNPYWKEAVFRRAGLIDKTLTGARDAAGLARLREARDAWGEAASWLSPNRGSADFAVACLHAAEHSFELGEPNAARRYLDTMFSAEDVFLASGPREAERDRFFEHAERGLYTLGEIHRSAGRPDLAQEAFESAIERYPGSTRVPVAYLMLGILAEERGDPAEALALYRRGKRKAEAIGPDRAREPFFDVSGKLDARIRRIEATR